MSPPAPAYPLPPRPTSFSRSTPNINGVKEASGNFSLLSHTRALCGDDFHIWSGNDDQVVPMMSLGAKGVVSVAANLVPEVMVQMSHLCLEGGSGRPLRSRSSTPTSLTPSFWRSTPSPSRPP